MADMADGRAAVRVNGHGSKAIGWVGGFGVPSTFLVPATFRSSERCAPVIASASNGGAFMRSQKSAISPAAACASSPSITSTF